MAAPLVFDGIERVLVVTAHPDDCDFGCAGTIALMTSAAITVSYCICTDGDAGGFDESIGREDMARMRRQEQTAAASELGVTELSFLGYKDGQLMSSLALRRDISRLIRRTTPDLVICQSPERNYQRIGASHPDHMAAGDAALCAVYPDARNPFAHPSLLSEEGLRPHTVATTWIMSPGTGEATVDITDVFDRKLAALLCHKSQLAEPEALEERLRSWNGATAERAGLSPGRLAEAFLPVDTR